MTPQDRIVRRFECNMQKMIEYIIRLEDALLEHRNNLHHADNKPCPTCMRSAEVLDLAVTTKTCANGELDKRAIVRRDNEVSE